MAKQITSLENLRFLDSLSTGDFFGMTFKVDYDGKAVYEEHKAIILSRTKNKLDLILDGSSEREKHFYMMSYENGQDPDARVEKGRLIINANLISLSVFYPSPSYDRHLKLLKEAGFL